jgi:hypothetical protein
MGVGSKVEEPFKSPIGNENGFHLGCQALKKTQLNVTKIIHVFLKSILCIYYKVMEPYSEIGNLCSYQSNFPKDSHHQSDLSILLFQFQYRIPVKAYPS